MLETLAERDSRTVRGNRTLIALRLLLATLSLFILLIQESWQTRTSSTGRPGALLSSGEVSALIFSDDGSKLISGGSDATIRIWDLEAGGEGEIPTIEGHGDIIYRIAVSPDGKKLASASADETVRVFDISSKAKSAQLLRTIPHDDPVTCVDWSPDGKLLLTSGRGNRLQFWGEDDKKPILKCGQEASSLTFSAFLPDGRQVVTTGLDGRVRFWDVETGACLETLDGHIRPIEAAAISKDGKVLVTGSEILRRWDLEERKEIAASEAHATKISALSFGGNKCFASGSRGGGLRAWTLDQKKELKELRGPPMWVLAIAVSPDGKTVAVGTRDQTIRLHNIETGAVVRELAGHRRTLRSAYMPPGARPPQPEPLYWRPEGLVVIIVLLLTILYTWALRRVELAPKLAFLQTVVDTALISALVYHTGATDSPFVTLYLVSIAAAAFVLSRRDAIIVASIAVILFSVLLLAYSLGYIPETYVNKVSPAQVRKFQHLNLLEYAAFLVLPVCAFFLVAVLAGNLSQRLAVTRLLHHEILEGIGEGILVLDTDHRVLYHNKEVVKLLQPTGKLEQNTLHQLLGQKVNDVAVKSLSEQAPRRVETMYKREDGKSLPFEVRMIPALDPSGPPRGLIVVLDDITAEKRMEEFFKHKERIEAMGELSASIAHEIRNPLASIRGAVQEISRSVEIPEDKKVLVEIVLSESDRLDQIISDFLRYARMRRPKLKEVDIGKLLTDLRLLLIARPESKDFKIQVDDPGDLNLIPGDVEQLRQVFLNLSVNALQAMDDCDRKQLSIRAYEVALHEIHGLDRSAIKERVNRPGICIEVADTGPGMPDDVRRQIFEPFFTTKSGGTGLGLAIVARIIQGHEGVVVARANEGGGTVFLVWIPSDLETRGGEGQVSA